MTTQDPSIERCPWSQGSEIYTAYHDNEWGVPVHDDRKFFEMLILEGAQAGLNWLTILKKREGYRQAFDNFDSRKVAQYDEAKIAALLQDSSIIRNRRKVESAVVNARAFQKVQDEFGSFDHYIWQFTGGQPIINHWQRMEDIPATTPESDALSKDLIKRGFKFVGSTICYALMQACGLVNDHTVSCAFRRV
jgi:DNA-3-methyladenine glycosylase I